MRLILKFVKMVVFVYLSVGLRRASTAVLTLQRCTDNNSAHGLKGLFQDNPINAEYSVFSSCCSLILFPLLVLLYIGLVLLATKVTTLQWMEWHQYTACPIIRGTLPPSSIYSLYVALNNSALTYSKLQYVKARKVVLHKLPNSTRIWIISLKSNQLNNPVWRPKYQ